jgi:hypothetical protein
MQNLGAETGNGHWLVVPGFEIAALDRDFFFPKTTWSHPPRGGGLKWLRLDIDLHLVPKLRMKGLLSMPSWRGQEQLHIFQVSTSTGSSSLDIFEHMRAILSVSCFFFFSVADRSLKQNVMQIHSFFKLATIQLCHFRCGSCFYY